jgi:small-conductance mechanosensitive channel
MSEPASAAVGPVIIVTSGINPWSEPAIIVLAALGVGIVLEFVVMARLRAWAATTEWKGDDLIVGAVRRLPILWCLLLGVHVAVAHAPVGEIARDYLHKGIIVAWILSATLVAMRAMIGFWRLSNPDQSITLVPVLIRLSVLATGIMVALQTVGISIAPMLTALGIGGLAVALALQDTLSNLFSGIHIVASKKVRLGDFIRLDTGDEGIVEDITWRNTTVRTLADNLVVMPNAKLSQAVVTNYSMPNPDMVLTVSVGVAYGSDLDAVERLAGEIAAGVIAAHADACGPKPPVVRFAAFGDSAIDCRISVWVTDFRQQFIVRHALIKAIHRAFAAAGIEIPYPTRTVLMRQDVPRGG